MAVFSVTDAHDMTKQTKIGLIVGMASVLLIAILVSDHLSRARLQAEANLTGLASSGPNVPATGRPADATVTNAPPIVPRMQRPVPQPGEIPVSPGTPVSLTDRARNQLSATSRTRPPMTPLAAVRDLQVIDPMPRPAIVTAQRIDPTPQQFHHVKTGETLAEIAQHYYGSAAKWRKIYEANRQSIRDPDFIRAGIRLVIPSKAAAAASPAPRATSPAAATSRADRVAQAVQFESYTVRAGDTLSDLAKRFYGSYRAWDKLVELNEGRIRDPNALQVGQSIRVPKR